MPAYIAKHPVVVFITVRNLWSWILCLDPMAIGLFPYPMRCVEEGDFTWLFAPVQIRRAGTSGPPTVQVYPSAVHVYYFTMLSYLSGRVRATPEAYQHNLGKVCIIQFDHFLQQPLECLSRLEKLGLKRSATPLNDEEPFWPGGLSFLGLIEHEVSRLEGDSPPQIKFALSITGWQYSAVEHRLKMPLPVSRVYTPYEFNSDNDSDVSDAALDEFINSDAAALQQLGAASQARAHGIQGPLPAASESDAGICPI